MWETKETAMEALDRKLIYTEGYQDISGYSDHFKTLSSTRIWPFNVETIASFIASFLSPLLLTIIGELLLSRVLG